MKKLVLWFDKWEMSGMSNECLNGLPLPTFINELGKDPSGKTWYVQVKFRKDSALYEIGFDFSENGETPFLKKDVIYAEDYWGARDRAYHIHEVRYDEFPKLVERFIVDHNID